MDICWSSSLRRRMTTPGAALRWWWQDRKISKCAHARVTTRSRECLRERHSESGAAGDRVVGAWQRRFPLRLLNHRRPLSPLRAKFVLIDLYRRATLIPAHHSPPRHEFQRYLAIELRRPTDGNLQI